MKSRRSRHDLASRATVSSKTLEVGLFGWSGVFTCGVLGYPAPRMHVARVTYTVHSRLLRALVYQEQLQRPEYPCICLRSTGLSLQYVPLFDNGPSAERQDVERQDALAKDHHQATTEQPLIGLLLTDVT